ncbi:MAG: AAA family ATPase [Rhodospirillaceae bacterium]|nr:AAA family ATPase [Rhodospirillaceae bacterium]
MTSLFNNVAVQPLAEKMRPNKLEDIVGQDHLLGEDGPLGRMLRQKRITSMILWGPPGSGKTTLARLLARQVNMEFEPLSAVFSGVSELRKVFARAAERKIAGFGTLLFIDEVHRFNRAQQDSFLPLVEDGTITLVGATTENPSFELNSALLSRCQVFVLKRIDDAALDILITRAEIIFKKKFPLQPDARESLKAMAEGDGRFLLNMVEEISNLPSNPLLDRSALAKIIQRRSPLYDKNREQHFNLISALHKSLRGSDVDAALYWLARMLLGGEDKAFILRRLTRFASEDIGLADPNALSHSLACWDAYNRIGSPEGDLIIAQCVIYLATAPKSNASYLAFNLAAGSASKTASLSPPNHILNAPTELMKKLGYSADYVYDHETEENFSGQNYFPNEMTRSSFYQPKERGFEREIVKRLSYWKKLRQAKKAT